MNAFVAIVLASLLARFGYQMARSPVLPRFAEHLGAAPELIGVIVAASTVTGIVFKLPAGALSDVLGRKRMMVLGAVFFAGPPFLYPLVNDAAQLLALRFVHGFATAIFSPVAAAYVAALSRHGAGRGAEYGRGVRMGWFSSAGDIGSAAGPLLGGIVLYYTASFAASYLLVGAIGVLTLVLVIALPEPVRPAADGTTSLGARVAAFRQGLRDVVATPAIFLASGVEAVMYLGFGAFLGFLPIYARSIPLHDAEIAGVIAVQLAVAALAKPFAGWLSDRTGRKPAIVVGLVACAAVLPLIFRAHSLAALLALAPLLGLGVATVTPVTNAFIADVAAAHRLGAAMGVFGTIWDIGEAAGPIVAGFLIGWLGYASAFDAIAAIMLLFAAGFAALVRGGGGALENGGKP